MPEKSDGFHTTGDIRRRIGFPGENSETLGSALRLSRLQLLRPPIPPTLRGVFTGQGAASTPTGCLHQSPNWTRKHHSGEHLHLWL